MDVVLACSVVCCTLFILRKKIFKTIGMMIYKAAEKSLESCSGKVTQTFATDRVNNSDNVFYLNTANSIHGVMINAKSVGQNFDLNSKENRKFVTPSSLQDLKPNDNLA